MKNMQHHSLLGLCLQLLLVSSAQSLPIYEVTTLVDGNSQQVTFSHFATKSGLSTASEGLIFVDQPEGSIDLLKPDGSIKKLAGGSGRGYKDGPALEARFDHIGGVQWDDLGNLYVADIRNNVIRKLDKNGFVSTIAGQPKIEGLLDGAGDQAHFSAPSDLLLHRETCSLLVADQGNRRLRSVRIPAASCAMAGEHRKTWTEYLKTTFCYFTIGFFLWCVFRALPTLFDKLISLAASVSQRFSRGRAGYDQPRDLLSDVEAPPVAIESEPDIQPALPAVCDPSPAVETVVQIEEESPPEAGPEDDTHVGAVMSTSPIPISFAGSPLEQGDMPQSKIGTSPQMFSMSPAGWERIEEQEKECEAGDQPEGVASHFPRESASTSVLREDYFAGLNPFRPEEREGDK